MLDFLKKFLVKVVIDGILYAFIGPFSMLFVIPHFLMKLSAAWGVPYFLVPGSETTGKLLTWSGAALAIWCTLVMFFAGRGTPLVTSSPKKVMDRNIYAILRHPMMWSITIVLIGEVLFFGQYILIAWFLAWLRIKHLYVVNYEEPQLERRFGDSWKEYCEKVPRWLPRTKFR